jgi:hypothetical protein
VAQSAIGLGLFGTAMTAGRGPYAIAKLDEHKQEAPLQTLKE